jgi:antitoxin component of MazEF toxin-antitoxin module
MRTRAQRWGNSIRENSTVDVSVKAGKLVVVSTEPKQSLDALVEQITDENRRAEIAIGRCVGNEVW